MSNPYYNEFLETVRKKTTEELVEIMTTKSADYSTDFMDVVYKVLDEERHYNMEQFKKEEPQKEEPVFNEVNDALFDYCDSLLEEGQDVKAITEYLATHGLDESTAESVATYRKKETRRQKVNFIASVGTVISLLVFILIFCFLGKRQIMSEATYFTLSGLSLAVWLGFIITARNTRKKITYKQK